MKKIGFVDYYLSEWHANNYPKWIKELDCGFEVTHAWAEIDISPVDGKSTAEWCAENNVYNCRTIEELCHSCDAIIILAPSNPEKHEEYAKEVFKHGKPSYIDKTFAPCLNVAQNIFDMAKRHSIPFFSTSALRFAEELDQMADGVNFIITGGGSNFDEYCIHTVEMAVKLLGTDIKTESVITQGSQKICVLTSGSGKKATIIYAVNLPFSIAVENPDRKNAYVKITSDFFKALMKDILRFFETKEVSFNTDETIAAMRIRDSILEK